jgi:hypothetical protein
MWVNPRSDKFPNGLKEGQGGAVADENYRAKSVSAAACHRRGTRSGRQGSVLSLPCASYKSLASRGTSVSSSAEASL